MKIILLIGAIIIFSFQSCLSLKKNRSNKEELRFLFVSEMNTTRNSYGQHIEIKQVLPRTNELIPMTIDDRDIINRSGYSRQDELAILKEYLAFEGDKRASNKLYRFKAGGRMIKPNVANFTIEIEALYSFTKMLTATYSRTKPVLINCTTGEPLNNNSKAVTEVYDIYRKWYKKNEKTDFQNITRPLAGSRYCWLGDDKVPRSYWKKSL